MMLSKPRTPPTTEVRGSIEQKGMSRSGNSLAAWSAPSVRHKKLDDSGEVNGSTIAFSTSCSSIQRTKSDGVSSLFPFQMVPTCVCTSIYFDALVFDGDASQRRPGDAYHALRPAARRR